jgi:hypothetical protein
MAHTERRHPTRQHTQSCSCGMRAGHPQAHAPALERWCISARIVTVGRMVCRARACAVLLVFTACSSATSPSAGLPGPQGTLLTTLVHGTPWRVGDTTKVDLVITDTSANSAVFELLEPVPTLEILDASGDSIPVTYLGPPNFLSLSIGAGATVVTSGSWASVVRRAGQRSPPI